MYSYYYEGADLQNVRSFFTILGCKILQALSFCVKIEVIELEKEVDYEIPRTQQKTSCDQAFY